MPQRPQWWYWRGHCSARAWTQGLRYVSYALYPLCYLIGPLKKAILFHFIYQSSWSKGFLPFTFIFTFSPVAVFFQTLSWPLSISPVPQIMVGHIVLCWAPLFIWFSHWLPWNILGAHGGPYGFWLRKLDIQQPRFNYRCCFYQQWGSMYNLNLSWTHVQFILSLFLHPKETGADNGELLRMRRTFPGIVDFDFMDYFSWSDWNVSPWLWCLCWHRLSITFPSLRVALHPY